MVERSSSWGGGCTSPFGMRGVSGLGLPARRRASVIVTAGRSPPDSTVAGQAGHADHGRTAEGFGKR
jgi:hypothetical protein